MKTRVRFAPSPTGPLHIGGLRTALYNYLFAKKNKGTFILRIEDTDQNRLVAGSEKYILKALSWAGIPPDEGGTAEGPYGPYRQSERKELYQQHIQQLLDQGKAYYAFDSDERLQEERNIAQESGNAFLYNAKNRMNFKNSLTLSDEETKKALENQNYVVRLNVMPGELITVFDEIRGTVTVNSDTLDDKILLKKDGLPTYHFANVVDDYLMDITHVIRGEEWLPSLAFHQLLYRSFEWKTPAFVHLPLILKPSGQGKLSKRDGSKHGFPVFPLAWEETDGFKEKGFLPQGLVNYLALLGWRSDGEKELYSLLELESQFGLKGLQKGSARFDFEKAKWTNQQHLRNYTPEKILESFSAFLPSLDAYTTEKQLIIISLVLDRVELLTDFKKELTVFTKNPEINAQAAQKIHKKNPLLILEKVQQELRAGPVNRLKEVLFAWAKTEGFSVGPIMQSLRVAIVGELAGPDLFAIMEVLEKDVTLNRIANAIVYFKNLNNIS